MNVYGQLVRAQLEVRTSDHVGTIPGMVWFHNTEKRIKFSEGTLVVSLLANDQNAVFGTNGTAANNVRLQRSKDETLQLVTGDDATAEGTASTSVAQLDARMVNYTDGTRPAFGNIGRLIYNTTAGRFEGDSGVAWDPIGSGGGGVGIEAVEHDCDARQAGVLGPGFDNFVCEAFNDPKEMIEGFLMETLAASSTAPIISWQPKFLDSANKNSDFEAGYLAVAGTSAGSIVTTGTFKIGTSATQFSKTSGTATAFIQHDVTTALAPSLAGNGLVMAFVNLSTNTNVDSIAIRLTDEIDNPTNFSEFIATTQHDGSTALATGWNLVSWDVRDSTIETATGTGWDTSKLLRTFAWGINTATTTQTLDLIIDSLNFAVRDSDLVHPTYQKYGQAGNEYDVLDNSNRETIIIDSASARIIGDVTLDTGPTNTYVGGTASIVTRGSLEITGDNRSHFQTTSPLIGVDLASGASDLTQTIRRKKILKGVLSAATVTTSATFDTELYFDVSNGAATATTIELVAPVDPTAELKSGDVLHIVNVYDNDGSFSYVYSGNDFTLTADATWATSVLTLTGSAGDVTNTATGDMLVKEGQIEAFLSVVSGATTDESLATPLTRSEIIITDVGLPYPQASNIFGHYFKLTPGLANSTQAAKNVKAGSPGVDWTIVGTGGASFSREFKNGQLGAGTFDVSNRYDMSNADSDLMDPDSTKSGSISGSMWVKILSAPGSGQYMLSRMQSVNGNPGWSIQTAITTGAFVVNVYPGISASTAAPTFNTWNHVAWSITDGGKARIWLNGTRTDSAGTVATGAQPTFGMLFAAWVSGTGGDDFDSGYVADLVLWHGVELSDSEVESMRALGNHRVLGANAGYKYRYVSQSQSGDKLTAKAEVARRTNAVEPFLTSFLAGQTS